jgi:large subunit ribosomal protein L10
MNRIWGASPCVGSNLSSFAPRSEGGGPCLDKGSGGQAFTAVVSGFWGRRLGETAGDRSSESSGQMRTEAVDRAQKSETVSTLNQVFSNTGVVVVAHYSGLTVAQMTTLRGRMRDAGASLKVAKNRLVKLALKGTDAEHISDLFQGPTVIAYSNDPVAAPKVAAEFAKTNEKFVLLGGAMGKTNLDAKGVEALATMPSLDELRAKLVGMIKTPATRIAGVLQAPAGQLARVLGAYAKKDEAA